MRKKRKRVNWHAATVSAIRLELLAYEDVLEYQTEYTLAPSAGKKEHGAEQSGNRPKSGHGQRIDLLIIKKLTDQQIPVSIARFFNRLNVVEIKGKNDRFTTDAYYKAIGYVSQLIVLSGGVDEYTRKDVTLTLITQSYPAKLVEHLKDVSEGNEHMKVSIEKVGEGLYDISGETYQTQLIVMKELPEEEYRYLRCLCDLARNQRLLNATIEECNVHRDNPVYDQYANEITRSVHPKEVDLTMCEGIFEFFGTSSAEVAEKAAREASEKAQIKIDALNRENACLRALLEESNIPIPAELMQAAKV